MNIFRRELKAYQKSTIIWALALSSGVIVFMTMFPAFTSDVEASRKILSSFPPALRAVINLSLENFFSVLGFYSYMLSFVVMAGAIQAMNLGTGILSKEVSGKTADFLLTKPVTRARVFLEKLLSALIILVLTNIVFVSVSVGAATSASSASFSYTSLLLLALTMFIIQMFFLALGFLFSVLLPRVKSVIAVSLPTVFTFYIIGALDSIFGNETVRYITPFKFFVTDYIIKNNSYEAKYLYVGAVFMIISLALSFLVFINKDVRAAS